MLATKGPAAPAGAEEADAAPPTAGTPAARDAAGMVAVEATVEATVEVVAAAAAEAAISPKAGLSQLGSHRYHAGSPPTRCQP